MSITLLFSKPKVFTIGEGLGAITLDLLKEETHDRTSVITDHAVEASDFLEDSFSDHISNDPEKLSLKCFVTNTPISLFAAIGNLITGADKVQSTFDALEELYENKEIVTVVTNLKVYYDMAIESMTIPFDKDSGSSLEFDIDFKKVIKAYKEIIAIPPSFTGGGSIARNQASSPGKAGKKIGEKASAVKKAKSVGILKAFVQGIFSG